MPENEEKIVVTNTVIPALEHILGANAGLMSDKSRLELEAMHAGKVDAAKKLILESGGTLPAEEVVVEEEPVVIEETPEQIAEKLKNETPEEKIARELVEKKTPKVEKVELKENSFGIRLQKNKPAKSDLVIDKAEDIIPTIEKLYGQKLKDLTEMPKFFETTNKWREDSQKLGEAEKTSAYWKSVLENLTPSLLEAVKLDNAGKDYMTAINNKPAFDFSKPVEKQDKAKLVSTYLPNKFTAEQLETIGTDEQEPALEIAVQLSQDKYSVEKEKRDGQIVVYQKQAEERVKLFSASVEASVGNLKQSFPDVAPAAQARIKQTLSGGPNAIVEIFCNPDGSYKPGAAEMLLLAQEGKMVMTELMAAAERAAETRVNEEIVNRGANGAKIQGKGAGKTTISPEVQKKVDELNQLKKQVHF